MEYLCNRYTWRLQDCIINGWTLHMPNNQLMIDFSIPLQAPFLLKFQFELLHDLVWTTIGLPVWMHID